MDKLKATYDKEEEIPSIYKELFEKKGEKFCVMIEGIQTDANVHKLEQAIKNERDENAQLRKDLKSHPKNPEEVNALMEELEATKASLATAGKPNDEQLDKLLEARLRTKLGPLERQLEKTKKELEESTATSAKLDGIITKGKMEFILRAAAEKAKVLPTAMQDVLMRGTNIFEFIDVQGKSKLVTKDGVGVTPGLEPDAWLEEAQPGSTHWWGASVGAGANGNKGGGFQIPGKNPWGPKPDWNMTEQGRVYTEHGPEKAAQLAESVGSRIGATSPPLPRGK